MPAEPERAAAVEAARERLARAQARERGGRYTEALALLTPMISEADALAYLPHMAEVHLLAGKLYMYMAKVAQASAHIDLALRQGLEGKVDEIAAEALVVDIFILGYQRRRPEEALARAPLAWSLVRRAGNPPRLAALLHNNVASVHFEFGAIPQSAAEYEESLALLVKHAPDDPLRWAVVNNLGNSLNGIGQFERARELAEDALREASRRLYPCHPTAASLHSVLASGEAGRGNLEQAFALYEQALACFGEEYPDSTLFITAEVAELHHRTGDDAEARRTIERVDAIIDRFPDRGWPPPLLEVVRIDLDLREGRISEARERFAGLRVRAEGTSGSEGFRLFGVYTRLALLAHLEHDDATALKYIERAAPLSGPNTPSPEQGLHSFTHARVLHGLGREPGTIVALAERAIAAYRAVGHAFRISEIEDCLVAHPELRAPWTPPGGIGRYIAPR